MNNKLLAGIIIGIVAVGCAVAVGLLIYTIILYQNVSITSFISNGR